MATREKAQIRFCVTKLMMVFWILSLLAVSSPLTFAQAKKPITKVGLSEALKENGLSPKELARYIQQRGVSFQVNAEDEADLRAVGARPEVIEAARANYRPTATLPSAPSKVEPPPVSSPAAPPAASSGTASTAPIKVPPGPPLSKNEVITMLQSGVAVDRVERFVEVRGVNFNITQDIAREIMDSGGNRSLLGAISEKSSGPAPSPAPSPAPVSAASAPTSTAPDYDDLTDQAQTALSANQYVSAVRILQQAIKVDPSQSRAYQMLGKTQLYHNRDFVAAERTMRAAVEHGGEAVFEVFHDHDGFFKTYCKGSFFVSKGGVNFRADDGRHTFEADDSVIKEVKVNGFTGIQFNALHLKIIAPNGKLANFNFAPSTAQRPEADLIIALVTGYQGADDAAAVTTSAARIPPVDEILDLYAQAIGGRAAIEQVTSRVMRGSYEMPARGVSGTVEFYLKAPKMSVSSVSIPGAGMFLQGFDGSIGWAKEPKKEARNLAGVELAQAIRGSDLYFDIRIREYYSGLSVKGIATVENRQAYLIEATFTAGGGTEKCYFDTETGLLIRRDSEEVGSQGKMPVKSFYEDYREVGRIKLPYTYRQVYPYGTVVIRLNEVTDNVSIPDGKFSKPVGR